MYDSKEDTLNHIINVRKYAGILQNALFEQISKHDKSKLEEPEKPIFDEAYLKYQYKGDVLNQI